MTKSHVAECGSTHLQFNFWETEARGESGVPGQPNSLGYIARPWFVVLSGGRKEEIGM